MSNSSMEKSLSKVTLVFQLIGIQYFSISSETLKDTSSLNRKFKWIFVVNILITICEFCATLYMIHLSKNGNDKGNAGTWQIVQLICCNFMIIVRVVTMLNSLLLRKKAEHIFKNFQTISKVLMTLNQCVDYETFADQFKIYFVKLIFYFIGFFVVALVSVFLSNVNVFLWAALFIYPNFFIVFVFSYWTLLVRLVREQLRSVKDSLVQLQRNDVIFRIDPDTRLSEMETNHETYDFFVKLKRIYGLICGTTSIVNELIAVPICLILILLVIANVSGGYKVFLSFRNDIPFVRVIAPICAIFGTLLNLYMLTFSCSSTYAATNDILAQVHKFEFSKLDRECNISTILTEFSLQIVQQPIQFTVGGFGCLTQPLLATIVTGVVTYVMILAQFS